MDVLRVRGCSLRDPTDRGRTVDGHPARPLPADDDPAPACWDPAGDRARGHAGPADADRPAVARRRATCDPQACDPPAGDLPQAACGPAPPRAGRRPCRAAFVPAADAAVPTL